MLADPRIAEKKMPILHPTQLDGSALPFSFAHRKSAARFLNNKVDQPAASPPQETMQAGQGEGPSAKRRPAACRIMPERQRVSAQALGLDRITDRPAAETYRVIADAAGCCRKLAAGRKMAEVRPWQLFSCDALKGDGVEEAQDAAGCCLLATCCTCRSGNKVAGREHDQVRSQRRAPMQ